MLKCCVVLFVASSALDCCSGFVKSAPNIAVIGSGPAGLVSAKYAIEQGLNVTVYVYWWYTDEIGENKYGIPIHRIFAGEEVLVIGSGSSGIDLVALLSQIANHVTWSRRATVLDFPYKNVSYKGEVKRFTKTGAQFVDGSEEAFMVIFYATGYNFDYPFLTNDSGVTVDNNFVHPLYKHIFNIEHPTMAFIGIPSGLLPTFPTVELQARFALQYLSGARVLPSKDEMLNDIQSHMEVHMNRHQSNRSSQFFELEHRDYFKELSDLTNIQPKLYRQFIWIMTQRGKVVQPRFVNIDT